MAAVSGTAPKAAGAVPAGAWTVWGVCVGACPGAHADGQYCSASTRAISALAYLRGRSSTCDFPFFQQKGRAAVLVAQVPTIINRNVVCLVVCLNCRPSRSRYNDWQHDPFSADANGTQSPGLSIAARDDLDPSQPQAFGNILYCFYSKLP